MTHIRSVDEVLQERPAWVKYQINNHEARALALEFRMRGVKSAIEIGVASGFSSAILYSALAQSTDTPQLNSFDLSEACYFDPTRKTGQAVGEVHGEAPGFMLRTGVTAADIDAIPGQHDFLFIDASHLHPWATLDLLSLTRFLKPGALIALHDIFLPIKNDKGNHNGPRDLFRTWIGAKFRYDTAPNLGFIELDSDMNLAESIRASLKIDWEVAITLDAMESFVRMSGRFGAANAEAIEQSLRVKNRSAGILKPRKFPVDPAKPDVAATPPQEVG